jgi:hypothetical protein
LETCIVEVLAKPVEGAAVEVRRLLRNIRQQTLTAADTIPISASIAGLPQELTTALLRSAFGLYTDPRTDAAVKNNVLLIAPAVWNRCSDQVRYEIGLKYSSFSVNGEVDRRDLARNFLVRVNGLTFQPESMLALEFQQKLDQLERTHNAFDNFYNEPGVARDLRNLVPTTGNIPPSSTAQYVKVVALCRIGNPYGISRAAISYYDQMIDRFQELHIRLFAKLVTDSEVSSRPRVLALRSEIPNHCDWAQRPSRTTKRSGGTAGAG